MIFFGVDHIRSILRPAFLVVLQRPNPTAGVRKVCTSQREVLQMAPSGATPFNSTLGLTFVLGIFRL